MASKAQGRECWAGERVGDEGDAGEQQRSAAVPSELDQIAGVELWTDLRGRQRLRLRTAGS
jgi:hypothetical protein